MVVCENLLDISPELFILTIFVSPLFAVDFCIVDANVVGHQCHCRPFIIDTARGGSHGQTLLEPDIATGNGFP